MEKLSQPPVKWTSWPIAMSVFVVTLIVYGFYFNYSEPLKSLAGEFDILDMRGSGYELSDVRELMEYLGKEGRTFYVKTTLLDTVWPLLIAVSAVFSSALAFRAPWLITAAAFFPVAFGVLDAFENAGLLIMLSHYPDISASLVNYCASITQIKWMIIPVAFPVFFGLPLVALGRFIIVKVRGK